MPPHRKADGPAIHRLTPSDNSGRFLRLSSFKWIFTEDTQRFLNFNEKRHWKADRRSVSRLGGCERQINWIWCSTCCCLAHENEVCKWSYKTHGRPSCQLMKSAVFCCDQLNDKVFIELHQNSSAVWSLPIESERSRPVIGKFSSIQFTTFQSGVPIQEFRSRNSDSRILIQSTHSDGYLCSWWESHLQEDGQGF